MSMIPASEEDTVKFLCSVEDGRNDSLIVVLSPSIIVNELTLGTILLKSGDEPPPPEDPGL